LPRAPCVYILASRRRGTLYTGVTSNLSRRVFQHREDPESPVLNNAGITARLVAGYVALCQDPMRDLRRWLDAERRPTPQPDRVAGYMALCQDPMQDLRRWLDAERRPASPVTPEPRKARSMTTILTENYLKICHKPTMNLRRSIAGDDPSRAGADRANTITERLAHDYVNTARAITSLENADRLCRDPLHELQGGLDTEGRERLRLGGLRLSCNSGRWLSFRRQPTLWTKLLRPPSLP